MATKKKKISEDDIVKSYMDYVLETETFPKSVYKFCKENKFKEEEFYQFYGSLESLQKGIWEKFFANTIKLIKGNKDYSDFSNKDKMLTFFYTFFEVFTLNRSYVLFALQQDKNPLKNLTQLKGLRINVKDFAKELIDEGNSNKTSKFTRHNPTLYSEGAWLQFLFVLKFWMNDDSPGFEKTDMAIEKSINTIFDVFENTPLDNIVDFGKFLYKETIA